MIRADPVLELARLLAHAAATLERVQQPRPEHDPMQFTRQQVHDLQNELTAYRLSTELVATLVAQAQRLVPRLSDRGR